MIALRLIFSREHQLPFYFSLSDGKVATNLSKTEFGSSNLNLKWNNIILKNQADDNMDDFLSYGVLNTGSEIHFLFIDKEKFTDNNQP